MLAKLNKRFPKIIDISRDSGTNNLIIYCRSIAYIRKIKQKEEEIKPRILFNISCVETNDHNEPYTEETLKKALKEFPTL